MSIKNKIDNFLPQNKTIAVWGAGGLGQASFKYYLNPSKIDFVIDKTKHGQSLFNKTILPPEKMDFTKVDILIICSAAHAQIRTQAESLGFKGKVYYIYELIAEVFKDSSSEFDALKLDIYAVKNANIFRLFLDKPQLLVNLTFRTGNFLSKHWYLAPLYWIMYFLHAITCLLTSIQLPLKTQIGPGLGFAHYGTIVFSKRAQIGSFFTIYHGCTVGTNFTGKAPVIGDFVTQYAGSHILGDSNIADHCVIGANSVALDIDSAQGDTIIGAPAKIKRKTKK